MISKYFMSLLLPIRVAMILITARRSVSCLIFRLNLSLAPPPLLTPPLYPIQAYCHLSPSVDIANIIWNRNHWSTLSHSVRVAPVSTVLDYTNVIVVTLSQARKQWCLCERDSFGLVISVLLREHNGTFAIHNQQLCTQS